MDFLARYLETDRNFYRRLLLIAVPVILQTMITTGVNLVDNIMLGQLTETVLSGSTQANQFIALFNYTIMGISMGASVLSSRFLGAQDFSSLKKAVAIALRFCLLLGLALTLANVFLTRQILSLYFRPEALGEIQAGITYLRWSTAGYLLMAVSVVLTNIMRSINMSNLPLVAAICAFAINIGANYVLIFGKFGFPEMGVAGAALGTVIARVMETSLLTWAFLHNKRVLYQLRDFLLPCRDLVPTFLRISVPVMLSDCLLGMGDNMLAIIMGQIGSSFVSANAITTLVQRTSTIFISGLSFSGCFLTGQMMGEGRVQEARKQGYTYLFLGTAVGIVAALLIRLAGGIIIDGYKITEETKQIADQLMNGLCVIAIFRVANSILTKGVLRGGGDTRFLLMADMSTMWLLAVPLGALGGLILHLPAFYTYLLLYCDQIVKAFWCVWRLRSGKWIKKIGLDLVEPPSHWIQKRPR